MCESRVFLEHDGEREVLMEDVVTIVPDGQEFDVINLFGEKKRIKAKLQAIKLLDHEIILTQDS